MQLKFIPAIAGALVLSTAVLPSHAALVLAGEGSTVSFYYDDAFWNPGVTATVSGDSVAFSLSPTLAASATLAGGGLGYDERVAGAGPSLVVVPKTGFGFAATPFNFTAGLGGAYALAGSGGDAFVFSAASIHSGSWNGSDFGDAGALIGADISADGAASSDGSAGGLFAATQTGFSGTAAVALGLYDVFYSTLVLQGDDSGSSTAWIDSLSYSVSASAIVAEVPEPGSLALLFTALGLGALVRRKPGKGDNTDSGARNA